MKVKNLLPYMAQLASGKGVRFTIGSGLKRLFHLVYYDRFKSFKKTFVHRGQKYGYLHHYFYSARYNKRVLEIPIILKWLTNEKSREKYFREEVWFL